MKVAIGDVIGDATITRFNDEPNTGLAVIECRGWSFTVPTFILELAADAQAGLPSPLSERVAKLEENLHDALVHVVNMMADETADRDMNPDWYCEAEALLRRME